MDKINNFFIVAYFFLGCFDENSFRNILIDFLVIYELEVFNIPIACVKSSNFF